MRVLITGATGFVGPHLVDALHAHGSHQIVGVNLSGTWPDDANDTARAVPLHTVNLLDTDRLTEILSETGPEWIFHLAGYANTGKSFREPEQAWEGNLAVTQSLYRAVDRARFSPRILFVSSGLIYGDSLTPDWWCNEDTPLRPASPYAASKAAADLLSYQVTRHPGLDVLRARPFNHIGPRQSPDYAVANFARQIAEIERGERSPVLETGNLDGQRDLTDVRDVARAYIALMEKGESGNAYNVATGITRRIGDVLNIMLSLTEVNIEVRERIDPTRRHDTGITRADITRLQETTGWAPDWALEESLTDILNWWRKNSNHGTHGK